MDALKNNGFGKSLPIKKKIYLMILIDKIKSAVKKIEKENLCGLTPLFVDYQV